jgi:hypothetical protein
MINYDPPTETDGPLGAISIARYASNFYLSLFYKLTVFLLNHI